MGMYNAFVKYYKDGLLGKNKGIPLTGSNKLGMYTSDIQKSRYWLVGGESSTGKTSLVDELFVLNVLDWYYKIGKSQGYKVNVIYNSMERNYVYKLAKWTAYKLFLDTGLLVSSDSISGHNVRFYDVDPLITKEIDIVKNNQELIDSYVDFFNPILENEMLLYDEATGPTGIFKRCTEFAFKNGQKKAKKYGWDYEYEHPNHFVIIVNDHVGKIRKENGLNTDKDILDKHSEYMGVLREKYMFIVVDIYQFNRSMTDSQRKANGDVYPTLNDFKGSGDGVENADHVIAIFNPYKHNLTKYNGYETDFFMSADNKNRLRTLSLLKNSYGADDLDFGLGFLGEVGKFYELPNADEFNMDVRNQLDKLLHLGKVKNNGLTLNNFQINFD